MTTTKSPAEIFAEQSRRLLPGEIFAQRAEALANQLKSNPYMDTFAKTVVSVGGPLYLAMEGYDRYLAYMQARNARTARQRVRINRNPSSRSGRREL